MSMAQEVSTIGAADVGQRFRLGGVAALVSGAFFLAMLILQRLVGDPPSGGARLVEWAASHRVLLALTNESIAFAAGFLLPAVLALYRRLGGSRRPWVAFGCALLGMVVPVLLVLLAIVHGRLMYPVFGITVDDSATVALIVSLYAGGMHMVSLVVGAALVILGLAMRRSAGVATVGVAAGVLQIAGSYPWLLGPVLAFLTQATLVAWLVVVGVWLLRARGEAAGPDPARP